MKNILKNAENAEKLLELTSDTMILLDRNGICVDIAVHNADLWFLKENQLLDRNILQLLPSVTYRQVYPEFKKVLAYKEVSARNYELTIGSETYFFKCIMRPYEDMVLCQYRDITERSQRKRELEKRNHELNEIQKAALIGRWKYNSGRQCFYYTGHSRVMCTEEEQEIPLQDYIMYILPEDREIFGKWLAQNLQGNTENSIMRPYEDMVLCQYRDITERSQRKRELEKRNHELNEIQKAALIGRWKYNSGRQCFYYTGHSRVMCTEEEQEIPLQDYIMYILPEDREIFGKWLAQNLQGNTENSIDYRIRFKKRIFYIRLKTFSHEILPDGTGILEGYIQNITDIQQRRNDITLLTHAINNSTEDIFAAREDGTLVFANRRFREHHNISMTDDVSTLNIYRISTNAQDENSWQGLIKSLSKGEKRNGFILYHPLPEHPEVLAMEGSAYWVTSDKGEAILWGFSRDITQRIRNEQQIKRFSQILDKTIENLPAGIVVKDIQSGFKYLYRNRESYNRNIPLKEALGKDDFDFYPLELAQEKRKQDVEIARTGIEKHWITEEHDQNGKSIFLDKRKMRIESTLELAQEKRKQDVEIARTGIEKHWITEEHDQNGKSIFLDKRKMRIESSDFPPILLSIEWDITEMERMKRELLVAKEKAETSDQLKSAFLANMSHEIRTPLNAIVGFSRIIAESTDAEERQDYYDIVEANNERLLQLINEILDLSKIEAGMVEFTITPVRLHPLCKEIHDALKFRCPEGVELVYEASDEEIVVEGDKNRIFQVISNLIGNAFKFTTSGSVGYGYRRKGNGIEFHVSDTGIGIETDKLARVFERFVKVNNFAQGTGLGLSICKTIIERLGGTISVSSEVGKGTTFTFTLPLAEGKREPAEEQFGSGKRNDLYLYPAPGRRQKGTGGRTEPSIRSRFQHSRQCRNKKQYLRP